MTEVDRLAQLVDDLLGEFLGHSATVCLTLEFNMKIAPFRILLKFREHSSFTELEDQVKLSIALEHFDEIDEVWVF